MRAEMLVQSIRSVQVRVLPHLPLNFLAEFLMVHQRLASAKVPLFHLLLSPLERAIPIAERAGLPLPLSGKPLCPFGSIAVFQDIIVECRISSEGSRIALASATADQLSINPR